MWLCYEAQDNSEQPCAGAGVPIGFDEWHHVAAVRTASVARLYLDGEEVGEAPVGIQRISQSEFLSFIGTDTYDPGTPLFLNATVDDLRIYNRSLGPDEVEALATDR